MRTSAAFGAMVLVAVAGLARGQSDGRLDIHTPPSVDLIRNVDSGEVGAVGGGELEVVWGEVVRAEGAAWVRLWFGPTHLAGDPAADGAVVRMTSLDDGAVQELNAETLAMWSNSSAYFNGSAVRVEVLARAGTGTSRVRVERVTAGQEETGATVRTICGPTDDRVLSNDPRSGRLVPVGCTAWLINDANREFLTAGHCGPTTGDIVEFNCPLSTSGGTIVHPAPQHQYPVHVPSIQTNGGLGVGNDYSYFGCSPNATTGLTAYQAQGATYVLAPNAAPTAHGQVLRITGYGVTSLPISATWSQAQKTHAAPITAVAGTALQYVPDTTGGNSGSGIEDTSTGLAIGIHTHGGCTSTGGYNQGTSLHLATLRAALASPRGVCLSGTGATAPPLYVSADLNNSMGTLSTTTGAFGTVAHFAPAMQGLAFDPRTRRFIGVNANTTGGVTTNTLWLIDPDTGAQARLGAVTGLATTLNGLGFDPASRTLYAIAQASGQLYQVDLTTRAATALGSPLGGTIGALDFDPTTGMLLGIDDQSAGSRLVRIDPGTRVMQVVGSLGAGIADCNGLGVDPRDGSIYTVHATSGNLLRVNAATGVGTVVGATRGVFGSGFGMAFAVTTSACPGDADADGAVTIADLEAFLGWYEAGDLRADLDDGSATFHRDAGVTIDDLLAFLAAYEAGC